MVPTISHCARCLRLQLCLSGLLHSLYGTQGYQAAQFPAEERATIAELIGERAALASGGIGNLLHPALHLGRCSIRQEKGFCHVDGTTHGAGGAVGLLDLRDGEADLAGDGPGEQGPAAWAEPDWVVFWRVDCIREGAPPPVASFVQDLKCSHVTIVHSSYVTTHDYN